jgi:hypothetical protein
MKTESVALFRLTRLLNELSQEAKSQRGQRLWPDHHQQVQRMESSSMLKRATIRACVLSMVVIVGSVAQGQIPTGSLNGLVTDPKDAIIVGARVRAVSATQGFSRNTITDSSGIYVLPDLAAGEYSLTIEQTGFAVTDVKSIVLEAARNTEFQRLSHLKGIHRASAYLHVIEDSEARGTR